MLVSQKVTANSTWYEEELLPLVFVFDPAHFSWTELIYIVPSLPEGVVVGDDDDSYVYAKGETQSAFLYVSKAAKRKRLFVFKDNQIEKFSKKYCMVSGLALRVAPSLEDVLSDVYAAYHDVRLWRMRTASNLWLATDWVVIASSTAYQVAKNLQDFGIGPGNGPICISALAQRRRGCVTTIRCLQTATEVTASGRKLCSVNLLHFNAYEPARNVSGAAVA